MHVRRAHVSRSWCARRPARSSATVRALVDRDAERARRPGPARAPAAPGGSPRSAACTSPRARRSPRPTARASAAEQQAVVLRRRSPTRAPPRSRPGPARAGPAYARARSVPPLAQWHVDALGSAATGADLVDRVEHRALHGDAPRRGRTSRRSCAHDAGNSAEHQPPLRPDAPKPATSRSTTTTRSVGSRLGAGSRRSTARCSRRRRWRRRRRGRPASAVARGPASSGGQRVPPQRQSPPVGARCHRVQVSHVVRHRARRRQVGGVDRVAARLVGAARCRPRPAGESSSGRPAVPSLTFTDASSRRAATGPSWQQAPSVGARASAQRPGMRWSVTASSAARLPSPRDDRAAAEHHHRAVVHRGLEQPSERPPARRAASR